MVIDIRPYCGADTTYNIHKLACVIANKTCQKNDVSETIILDLGSEGFDIVENGIEQAVKDITDILEIDHNRVVFRSSDRLCKSNIFRHVEKPSPSTPSDNLPIQFPKLVPAPLLVNNGTARTLEARTQ